MKRIDVKRNQNGGGGGGGAEAGNAGAAGDAGTKGLPNDAAAAAFADAFVDTSPAGTGSSTTPGAADSSSALQAIQQLFSSLGDLLGSVGGLLR